MNENITTSNDNQIRRDILKLLYQNFRIGKPYIEGANIVNSIAFGQPDIYANLHYLEDKGLVNVIWRTGGFPVAKINASGIDLLEDESEFNRKFPQSITFDSSINISGVEGPVTGIGVSGSNNQITSNTQILNSFNRINELASKLPPEYSKAFKEFAQNIQQQTIKNNTPLQKTQAIENSLADLVKETEGLPPNKEPGLLKKQEWKEKFFRILKNVLPVLPKTAETIAAFTPLSPFSKIIGTSVEKLVRQVQQEI